MSAVRLWNKNFTLLWQGQFVSQLGNQAFFIAMAFWIKQETESATIMGLVMMASQIPAILLSPIAGAYVDKHPRKAIIVSCDLINGLLILSLAAVFFLFPNELDWAIVVLFVVSVASSAVSTFFRPAVSAAIPDIVPHEKLNAANSLNQGSMQISTLLGQSAGGILYRVLGAPVLFLVDGLSYIFSAISEMFMEVPFTPLEEDKSGAKAWKRTWVNIKEGFFYIWDRIGMRNLVVMAAVLNFFGMPYIVLMPFFVGDTLGATPDWFGYIVASFSAGAMIGYLVAGTLRVSGQARSTIMIGALIGMTALFAFMGTAPNVWIALLIMFATGILNGFFNINLQTLFQVTTPSEVRGRVFSLLGTVAQGLTPIAMGLTGVVADLLDQDIRLIFVLSGSVSVVIALVVSFSREFREYLAWEKGE